MSERVAIFVDGANFHHGLSKIQKGYNDFHFDFEKFFTTITNGREYVGFWYYTAPIKGVPELNEDHQRLLSRLRKIPKQHVVLCKRQKKTTVLDEDGKEKPIYGMKLDDVYLSVDMVNEAWKNTFDTAILISGDVDILPAVNIVVKEKSKRVELLGFTGTTSESLVDSCSSFTELTKDMIDNNFFPYERPKKK